MTLPPSVFAQVLGTQFEQLPPVVQQLHGPCNQAQWRGEAQVQRGSGLLSRLCGWLARLPPAAPAVPISLSISAQSDGSCHWRRQFGRSAMPSRLHAEPPSLREDLGAVRLWFELSLDAAGIAWRVQRVRVLGFLPLPAAWFKQVHAWSGADSGARYRFEVRAQLPLLGLLVNYSGWLLPEPPMSPESA